MSGASRVGDELRAARLPTTRLGRAYLVADVDDCLERLAAAADAGRPLAPLVAETRFATTSLRRGYQIDAVDALLARVVGLAPGQDA